MDKDFSFETWKEANEIAEVCAQLLDNADLEIEINSFPIEIKLVFFVVGSDIKVVVQCRRVKNLQILKDPEEEPRFTVLETSITNPEAGQWNVSIKPVAMIDISCEELEWKIEKMTEAERNI